MKVLMRDKDGVAQVRHISPRRFDPEKMIKLEPISCKALTRGKTKCTREAVIRGYCLKHYRLIMIEGRTEYEDKKGAIEVEHITENATEESNKATNQNE